MTNWNTRARDMIDERAALINRARRLGAEIKQIFLDAEHWNRIHPDEQKIDPDPDGRLKRAAAAIDKALAAELGQK